MSHRNWRSLDGSTSNVGSNFTMPQEAMPVIQILLLRHVTCELRTDVQLTSKNGS